MIADFDELMKPDITDPKHESWYRNDGDWVHISQLQYHISWDWLMPVVKQILTIYNPSDKEGNRIQDSIRTALSTTVMIADVYLNVISFIEWYNNKQT